MNPTLARFYTSPMYNTYLHRQSSYSILGVSCQRDSPKFVMIYKFVRLRYTNKVSENQRLRLTITLQPAKIAQLSRIMFTKI